MKKLFIVMCGAILLPLPALSYTLAISATGRGASETGAVAFARRQAVEDAEAAGFLQRDGYHIGVSRVVELKRVGVSYIARVDAEIIKDLEPKRILLIVSGEGGQTPRFVTLAQRVRSLLATHFSGKQFHIEFAETSASDTLRFNSLADIQSSELDAEIDKLIRSRRADVLYMLFARRDMEPAFLVTTRSEVGAAKTIHRLRDSVSGNGTALIQQVVDAVRQDISRLFESSEKCSVKMLTAGGATIRKGKSVIFCDDNYGRSDVQDASIVRNDLVTAVSGPKARSSTDQFSVTPTLKHRASPLRGQVSIILESDW